MSRLFWWLELLVGTSRSLVSESRNARVRGLFRGGLPGAGTCASGGRSGACAHAVSGVRGRGKGGRRLPPRNGARAHALSGVWGRDKGGRRLPSGSGARAHALSGVWGRDKGGRRLPSRNGARVHAVSGAWGRDKGGRRLRSTNVQPPVPRVRGGRASRCPSSAKSSAPRCPMDAALNCGPNRQDSSASCAMCTNVGGTACRRPSAQTVVLFLPPLSTMWIHITASYTCAC